MLCSYSYCSIYVSLTILVWPNNTADLSAEKSIEVLYNSGSYIQDVRTLNVKLHCLNTICMLAAAGDWIVLLPACMKLVHTVHTCCWCPNPIAGSPCIKGSC